MFSPSSIEQSLILLPFSLCATLLLEVSLVCENGAIRKRIWLTESSRDLLTCSALTEEGTGDRSILSSNQNTYEGKYGDFGVGKNTGILCKNPQVTSRVQILRASPARDPAVCDSFWPSQQAPNFNTTLQHNNQQC